MVIVQPFLGSVKHYLEAVPFAGRSFVLPARCPHPECGAVGSLIRWGTYARWVCEGRETHHIRVQRIFCKACCHTHSLLPDFVHPYRHYATDLLQWILLLYLVTGVGWKQLRQMVDLPGSTARHWVNDFAAGAAHWLAILSGQLMQLAPLSEPVALSPPAHLSRIPDVDKRRRLAQAHHFLLLAEQLYAQIKARQVRLHFQAPQLFRFLLHWLQNLSLPPRLLWSPRSTMAPDRPC